MVWDSICGGRAIGMAAGMAVVVLLVAGGGCKYSRRVRA
jgi:hypothetical protein